MDRHIGIEEMDQAKNYEQVRYTASDPRNEGLGSINQRFSHDPSTNISANVRPPDYVVSAPRPVLNYSIQTGEEFAFEFMRDRAIQKQQFIPNAYGEPSGMPVYVDLKGVMGMAHPMSESGSTTPVLSASEKHNTLEHERKIPSTIEDKSYSEQVQSVPATSSRNGGNQRLHSFGSSRGLNGSLNQVKFLCSFGGKILPRPRDQKLRYVGGETRIIRISRDISYEKLMQKMSEIYSDTHAIKYQLPGEDLDALVSVSCDEDLQNMMEECDVLNSGESLKPRMFLFSSSDTEETQFGIGAVDGDSEVQYVVAVNGMDLISRKSSLGTASVSGNNLDELLNMNVDREIGRVASEPDAVPAPAPTPLAVDGPLLAIQTSQQGGVFPAQQVHRRGVVNHPVYTSAPIASLAHQPLSGYSPYAMNPATPPETPVPPHLHQTQQGVLREEQVFHAQDPEPSIKEAKLKRDGSFQKVNEPANVCALENNASAKESKMKREFSTPRVSEYSISSVSSDCPAPDNVSKEETPIVTKVASSTPDMSSYILPEKSVRKSQELVQNPGASETATDGRKANQDDQSSLPGGFSTSGYVSSGGDSSSISNLDQPVIHQRVFHSERILREQEETNRLSKSNDSLGSQFLMAQTSSDPFQPISELAEKFDEASTSSQNVLSIPPMKQPSSGSPWTAEETLQFEKSEESGSKINQMNSSISKVSPESTGQIPDQQRLGDYMNELGTMQSKGNFEDRSLNQNEAAFLNQLTRAESTYVDQSPVTAPKPPEFGWNNVAENKNWAEPVTREVSSSDTFISAAPRGQRATGPESPEQGDIVVDINDRFPRDFLADIFMKAKEDSLNFSGLGPLNVDGAGVSLNVQNHEPKNWSYFQNLAQDEFVRKDVSLMDQDHPGFPTSMTTGGAPIDYSYPPLQSEKVASSHIDPQIHFDGNIQPDVSPVAASNTVDTQQDYGQSQLLNKGDENTDTTTENTGVPLIDLTAGEFDIRSLQIIKNEDLEELKELGSGTFGTVYHGKWRGTDVAIKRIKKSCFIGRSSEQERLTSEFWHEAEILSKLHHPNVVAFYGVVQDGPGGTLATVTEFMVNGSLRHVLLSNRQLDRRKRLIIAMDAAFGMEYLHSKNIVHFDLKCDNLLVNLKDTARPICKVGDFGLSKIKRNTLVTGGVRGTLPWMAPELLSGSSSKVSEKVRLIGGKFCVQVLKLLVQMIWLMFSLSVSSCGRFLRARSPTLICIMEP
ncbi:PREDICTED: serine/threonine-protein kinase pakA-like isoform X2 [Tarenaya hassleriana]|uniref:serine/threonine-protein kinase pakA-like isoform X2 n=1 Tax=Tarenaya hassleriana TaxID=28532 RepID=UPI00053C296D|nr:PREDICTED: serine/threonine-protein kinase pakA-like isoform X2 [Tarenaya hassleriana]